MPNGPPGARRGTIVPRPGIVCNMVLVYEPVDPSISVGLSEEMRVANAQSAINERFAEPEEMGTAEITFRSDVEVLQSFVTVRTTTSFIGPDTISEIGDIIEREFGVPMEFFQVNADMRRKTLEADFL